MARGKRPSGEGVGCVCGDHWFASIGRGLSVIVSPADAQQLRYRWTATVDKRGYVCVTRNKTIARGKRTRVVLAREILEAPASMLADHASRDTLDNRRSNIRLCTRSQNAANAKSWAASGLKGVATRGDKFHAHIRVHGKHYFLGSFDTPEAAHAAYMSAATAAFGEFARAA